MEAVASFRESDLFTELERDALELAEALTSTPARVGEELYSRLRAQLNEELLVELTAAIAWKNYLARFNRTFDMPAGA